MGQIVIANRLNDGLVVFLRENGEWTESIEAGTLANDETAGQRLLKIAQAAEASSQIIDPYLITIDETGGQRRPVKFREAIRASGPTVQTGGN
jgi:hypothetical protein